MVAPYQSFISCFGTPWGFILASKGEDPRRQSAADIDALIAERLDPDALGYWDGHAHLHSFNLPEVPAPGDRDERPRHHRLEPPDRHLSRPPSLVLASASPRRRELLAQLGIAFTVLPSHIPEEHPPGPPAEAIAAVALAKARAVARRLGPERGPAVVLGADTEVVLDGRLLGKPRDAADAARMLRALRGRVHEVITGVALVGGAGREEATAVTTRVRCATTATPRSRPTWPRASRSTRRARYGVQGLGARLVARGRRLPHQRRRPARLAPRGGSSSGGACAESSRVARSLPR